MLCRKMPIKILSRAICQTWVFWETTTRKGKFRRSSTTSVEKMVAIRLLTPGCRGTAPELAAWIRLCPSSHRARELFLVCVCWCLGCAQNPAGTVSLGHIICLCQLGRDERLQQDSPPHCMEVWDGSCLFWCLRRGWMWEKLIFQPGQIMKILFLL